MTAATPYGLSEHSEYLRLISDLRSRVDGAEKCFSGDMEKDEAMVAALDEILADEDKHRAEVAAALDDNTVRIVDNEIRVLARRDHFYGFVDIVVEMFEKTGATNFFEQTMHRRDGGVYVLTVQRLAGKTPGQVVNELKAELERLRQSPPEPIPDPIRLVCDSCDQGLCFETCDRRTSEGDPVTVIVTRHDCPSR